MELVPADHPDRKKFVDLFQWVRDNGGIVHPAIRVKFMFAENRWLQVKDSVKKNEQLINIPNACIMSSG